MTENKRFTLKYINEQHISANIYCGGTFVASICIGEKLIFNLLNFLSEENEQLKKENQKLKTQLLHDGDGVCDICKHEYLIPSSNYFITKCIKGHEECSKEDIKYCEDFELIGDKPVRVTCPKKLEKKSAEKRYYALRSEGCIYPEFFDGGNDDLLMETEEVEDLLNEYEQLKQGINDLAQKFQDNIEFDKKQGITEYPIGFVSYIINYFKEGI